MIHLDYWHYSLVPLKFHHCPIWFHQPWQFVHSDWCFFKWISIVSYLLVVFGRNWCQNCCAPPLAEGQLFQPKWINKKTLINRFKTWFVIGGNFFGTKISTLPPIEAPVLSDLHFPKKMCDAFKNLLSVLRSVSKQVSVTATNVLRGALCKKFETPQTCSSSLDN